MAVITSTEYKTWAGVSGTALDSWLTATLVDAQSFAEEWCDRAFDSGTKTEYYNGHGTPDIQLRSPPINSLTSVSYISSVSSGQASWTVYDSSSYRYDAATGLLSRHTSFDVFQDTSDRYGRAIWPEIRKGIRVIYDGGYGAQGGTAMPAGLQLAMFRLIDYLREARGKSGAIQSETMGSYSYTRAQMAGMVTDDLMESFGFGLYRKGVA